MQDFEKTISIDKNRLDAECVSHAYDYYRYAALLADAETAVTIAKDFLKLTTSETALSIRQAHATAGDKTTEASISAEVECSVAVRSAQTDLREAEKIAAELEAGVRALEHKKSQLDNLVRLYVAGYFATPTAPVADRERDLAKKIN